MTRLVAPPIWHCHPDRIRCRHGHDRFREGMTYRGAGPVLLACPTCEPRTYGWGLQIFDPGELVTFYAVSREQLAAADRLWREQVTVLGILAAIGYHDEQERAA